MNPNEKIQLDDITFDDVIAGDGVDTIQVEDVAPIEEPVKEETTLEVDLEENEVVDDKRNRRHT